SRGAPVVSFGTRGRVDEEAVEQSEPQRKRALIGSYVLGNAVLELRRVARAKDRKRGIAIRGVALSRLSYVAEYLIVSPVLFDDVDDLLDRRRTLKESPAA